MRVRQPPGLKLYSFLDLRGAKALLFHGVWRLPNLAAS
jgi:hypothetical protein